MENKIINILAESGMTIKDSADFLREIASRIMEPAYHELEDTINQPLRKVN